MNMFGHNHVPNQSKPVFRAHLAQRRYREVRSRSSCSPNRQCGESVYSRDSKQESSRLHQRTGILSEDLFDCMLRTTKSGRNFDAYKEVISEGQLTGGWRGRRISQPFKFLPSDLAAFRIN